MSVCLGDVHSLHIVRCLDVQSYVGIYVGCMSCSGDVCGTYVWGMYICMSVCLGDVHSLHIVRCLDVQSYVHTILDRPDVCDRAPHDC